MPDAPRACSDFSVTALMLIGVVWIVVERFSAVTTISSIWPLSAGGGVLGEGVARAQRGQGGRAQGQGLQASKLQVHVDPLFNRSLAACRIRRKAGLEPSSVW
jgi:hypothetical protein